MIRANSYDVLITAVETVPRPDGKACVRVSWLDPNASSGRSTKGSANTVPGSTATTEALTLFHGSPDQRVDLILNGRRQIITVRPHWGG